MLAEALLNATAQAILVVDVCGHVSYTNAAAERLLEREDGLRTQRGLLAASTPAESAMLLQLIKAAAKVEGARGGSISVARPSGEAAWAVLVVPGAELLTTASLAAKALLFIDAPACDARSTQEELCRTHGLTRTEAAWATFLARESATVREAADHFGVTVNTAKTHLKRIFDKTNTRRQSDLVRLILGQQSDLVRLILGRQSGRTNA